MALQHAVLAFLADGPSYGYELKTNFERAVGPQWGGLNIGHVYQILDRLYRDGMVSSHHIPQDNRPDRTVYRITSAGQGELDDWLSAPTTRSAGYRDDFILKALAASRRGPDVVVRVCAVQREARMAELHTLRASRRKHADDPMAALTIEAAILHTQADLSLVDAAEAALGGGVDAAPGGAARDAGSTGDAGSKRSGGSASGTGAADGPDGAAHRRGNAASA